VFFGFQAGLRRVIELQRLVGLLLPGGEMSGVSHGVSRFGTITPVDAKGFSRV
jgi:hypothetical protein